MDYKSDIEIARSAPIRDIREIAGLAGIPEEFVECYGKYKAKIAPGFLVKRASRPDGKLILVSAVTPTPAGEGKTTTTVGLADSLRRLGEKAAVAIREPSLGPVFGMKGGAAGGGYAQVIPMEDINLHFTGDLHAVGAANNLLAAMLDNHIFQGNALCIDNRRIVWKRCVDINDRQLRSITDGLGGRVNGVPREDGFNITVASEVMAAFCLASDISDLKERLSRMVIAYTRDEQPITAGDIKAHGAMAALLKDAFNPNLVQTLEGTPAFIHGGPFANIAHGCNSVAATRMALKTADYVVTEAGFGADLGLEKFINIKCRISRLRPSAVVLVATVRALKHHGGAEKSRLGSEDLQALEKGLPNMFRHADNITRVFGLPAVIAVNKFPSDTDRELAMISDKCGEFGLKAVVSDVWAKGSEGGLELAREVKRLCGEPSKASFCYDESLSVKEKINAIVQKVYRGKGAELSAEAKRQAARLEGLGFGGLPICVAKTQYSFSDNAALTGAPEGFTVTVRELRLSAGAGFIVALTGNIMTMPGLPKMPAAELIDVDEAGNISGLF